jgi:transposase
MEKISTIGLDLAKNVFQVHGVNDGGQVVEQKQIRRHRMLTYFAKLPPCLIGIEACATAHYWGRELGKLGHQVKLIPPSYVKPYVRRGKNDAVDAAAICEAVTRPHMRFVAIKTEEQQAALMLHKTRDLLIRERVRVSNALRGHLAEFGYVFPLGAAGVREAITFAHKTDTDLPALAQKALQTLAAQYVDMQKDIVALEKEILTWHASNDVSRRLATIPGVGSLTASAIAATVGDAGQFKSGRELAAWVGLTPRQNSSGGKERLGGITRQGNAYIRRLLVLGATGQLRGERRDKAPGGGWFKELCGRKPPRVATVALANKTARVVWAVMVRGQEYRPQQGGKMANAA